MAVTNETADLTLSPQRDVRGPIRAIVAVVAAFVIGMTIGNVIDGGEQADPGTAAEAVRPTPADETFSPELARGLAQQPGIVADTARTGTEFLLGYEGLPEAFRQDMAARVAGAALLPAREAAAARWQGLAEAYADGSVADTVSGPANPASDIWEVRAFDLVSATPPVTGAQQAATDRLNGLAAHHSVPETFSPELIWAERVEPRPAGSNPTADRPYGMR